MVLLTTDVTSSNISLTAFEVDTAGLVVHWKLGQFHIAAQQQCQPFSVKDNSQSLECVKAESQSGLTLNI